MTNDEKVLAEMKLSKGWESIKDISIQSGISEANVLDAARALSKKGLIHIQPYSGYLKLCKCK